MDQGRPEDQVVAKEKLSKLTSLIKNPKNLLSVGVDGGEEIRAAISLFGINGTDVYGLDLDPKTLQLAKERLNRYGLNANLVLGSAIKLPFTNNSVDVILASAVMHEVYSYASNGKEAWKRAFVEASRVLSEGGLLLVRDFSATPSDKNVELRFKSGFSKRFYEYFRSNYRQFKGWEIQTVDMLDKRSYGETDYPNVDQKTDSIKLAVSKISELVMHFRNFKADYNKGMIKLDDPMWKEINEVYLPPNPNKLGIVTMPKDEYAYEVLHIANASLSNSMYKIECVANYLLPRPITTKALEEDFELYVTDSKKTSEELLSEVTNKMELIFKKVRKEAFA